MSVVGVDTSGMYVMEFQGNLISILLIFFHVLMLKKEIIVPIEYAWP